VRAGQPLALIHAADEVTAARAMARLAATLRLGETAPAAGPLIAERIVGTA